MGKVKRALLWLMALFYVAGGVYHLVNPSFYLQMMPPWIPWHLALIYLSGVAEIVLGIAVLVPQTRHLAAWGIVALLIAVFPANIHLAVNQVEVEGLGATWAHWPRLPVQGLLIAWALWYRRRPQDSTAAETDSDNPATAEGGAR